MAGVSVGLEQTEYTVGESEGAVLVCAILTGEHERNVLVTIATSDGSAIGTSYVCIHNIHNIHIIHT